MAMSPDGRQLGFTGAGADGISRVWLRSLESLEERPLAGTEGTVTFFWSPDSRFVAFQSEGKLKKIDISGGPPQPLCLLNGTVLGGSWNREGVLLFGTNNGPIMRVAEAGGAAVPVTRVEPSRDEGDHHDPTFLPDGRHFIYFRRSHEHMGVYAGSLDAKPEEQSLKRIVETEYSPGFAPRQFARSGQLLFLREGSLMAQAFDEDRLEVVGEAVPVADQVGTSISRAFFSVSANGILAYRTGGAASTQLSWYDRQGHPLGHVGEPSDYQDVALSPDSTRVAHTLPSHSDRQVWILDIARSIPTLLTFTTGVANSPTWSADGKRIAFSLIQGVQTGLYIQDASNSGTEQPAFRSPSIKYLSDWSRDGRFLLYTETSAASGMDIWALADPARIGASKPIAFANTKKNETQGQFSPDTHWVAYASDESGRYEVYVRPFPPGEGRESKWKVSSVGGLQPRWRGDGKELFYLAPDRNLMAVDIQTEPTFQHGAPHALFETPVYGTFPTRFRYDVTREGKRFLMVVPAAGVAAAPATVMLNWQEALRK
jgi:Tol biopolymer transport system component